jgi:hypothetical protein
MANGNGTQYLPGGGEQQVPQWFGIYQGYIAVNADPLAQGRVKLRIPQVFGNTTSGWASPMVPLSYIPPVSTPVTVMFVGGDPTQPVWFGNFALPGVAAGIVFDLDEPSNPVIGEIWVNSSTSLMSEWNGVTWVAYYIGGEAIADGVALSAPDITGGTITGAEFVATGTGGQYLGYDGMPGSGDLILSIAAAAGTDTNGNAYPAGLKITGTSGGTISIDPTAGGGVPAIQLVPESATHVDIPPEIYSGGLNLGTSGEVETLYLFSGQSQATANTGSALQLFSDPANSSTGGAYANFVIDGANTSLTSRVTGAYLSVSQINTGTNTAGNVGSSNFVNITDAWTLPANDAKAGTVYEIEVPVTGSMEGNVLNLGLDVNGSTFTNIVPVIASAFPTGDGFAGTVRLKLTFTATGTSGTVNLDMDGTLSDSSVDRGPSTSTTVNGHHSGLAFNTTVFNTIAIAAYWTTGTSSPSVSGITSKFTRIGP